MADLFRRGMGTRHHEGCHYGEGCPGCEKLMREEGRPTKPQLRALGLLSVRVMNNVEFARTMWKGKRRRCPTGAATNMFFRLHDAGLVKIFAVSGDRYEARITAEGHAALAGEEVEPDANRR